MGGLSPPQYISPVMHFADVRLCCRSLVLRWPWRWIECGQLVELDRLSSRVDQPGDLELISRHRAFPSATREAITVTGEKLFRQVWATPMSRLAREYGISGNGLAKICDRLTILYPRCGYWAKKAAGKKVVQYRLPEWGPTRPPRWSSLQRRPRPPHPNCRPKLVSKSRRSGARSVRCPSRLA